VEVAKLVSMEKIVNPNVQNNVMDNVTENQVNANNVLMVHGEKIVIKNVLIYVQLDVINQMVAV
jgi:hypothetical protein